MNITYKEYKEKLKIELNEFKEKLKLKLDEFKAKQNKKLENFKLKSSKRKIKGGDLSDEDIARFNKIIFEFINDKNTKIKNKNLVSDKTELYQSLFNDLIETNKDFFSKISEQDYDKLVEDNKVYIDDLIEKYDKLLNEQESYIAIVNQLKQHYSKKINNF